MLVLSRKLNESFMIGDNICVTVVDIRGDKVRIGIEAPRDVSIVRDDAHSVTPKDRGEQQP